MTRMIRATIVFLTLGCVLAVASPAIAKPVESIQTQKISNNEWRFTSKSHTYDRALRNIQNRIHNLEFDGWKFPAFDQSNSSTDSHLDRYEDGKYENKQITLVYRTKVTQAPHVAETAAPTTDELNCTKKEEELRLKERELKLQECSAELVQREIEVQKRNVALAQLEIELLERKAELIKRENEAKHRLAKEMSRAKEAKDVKHKSRTRTREKNPSDSTLMQSEQSMTEIDLEASSTRDF